MNEQVFKCVMSVHIQRIRLQDLEIQEKLRDWALNLLQQTKEETKNAITSEVCYCAYVPKYSYLQCPYHGAVRSFLESSRKNLILGLLVRGRINDYTNFVELYFFNSKWKGWRVFLDYGNDPENREPEVYIKMENKQWVLVQKRSMEYYDVLEMLERDVKKAYRINLVDFYNNIYITEGQFLRSVLDP